MRDFIIREFRHVLPPTIFFVVSFNILVLSVALIARGEGGDLPTYAAATVAALICGKAVLVADKLPFFNRYPEKPLIWNAAWKAGLYVLVTILFRLAEAMLSAATGEYGFAAGMQHEVAEFSWARFWAVQLWLVLLFFGYSAFRELVDELGRERIIGMYFGPVNREKTGGMHAHD
ncbi:hypothetical protein [Amaricoccus macauensis]|uniref:hypothetical protein n=1 Tax=Amaricoccus macauensis TaxID=57001 RepID=UPI003C7C3186